MTIRIGLVLSHSLDYCRRVLRGIKGYAEAKPDWILLPIDPEPRASRSLTAFRLAGVIAHLFTPALAARLRALRRPLVNVSAVLDDLPVPRVGADDEEIGRRAALHLLDRGFTSFGFVGQRNHAYSTRRERGFREVIERFGHAVDCYHERRARPFTPTGHLWALDREVQRWVRLLRKPVGVFAPNDIWGVQLAEICRQLRLRVPEDVSLVGVDNDDLLCNLSRPALSSIAVPAERIGHEAAALLDRLLAGAKPPRQALLLPPLGVVTRHSSEALAIRDADVAAAVRFIREHSHSPLRVPDVLAEIPVSRRSLERRFRASLQRGLGDEIRRVHMERARELLTSTEMPLAEVALRSGFSSGSQLSIVFRQEMALTPSDYRRRFRPHGGTV
jgi:LacI family transcriptional regulator